MDYIIAIALWCGTYDQQSLRTINQCREEMIDCLNKNIKTNIGYKISELNICMKKIKIQ